MDHSSTIMVTVHACCLSIEHAEYSMPAQRAWAIGRSEKQKGQDALRRLKYI